MAATKKLTRELIRQKYATSFRRYITGIGGWQMENYLSANVDTVRRWITSKFLDEMNWCNYGKIWVVDHIVPVRLFDIENEEDLKLCWYYKNLMPLLKEDNQKKHGNCFFAWYLLEEISGENDVMVDKLIERITPDIKEMGRYISQYHNGKIKMLA